MLPDHHEIASFGELCAWDAIQKKLHKAVVQAHPRVVREAVARHLATAKAERGRLPDAKMLDKLQKTARGLVGKYVDEDGRWTSEDHAQEFAALLLRIRELVPAVFARERWVPLAPHDPLAAYVSCANERCAHGAFLWPRASFSWFRRAGDKHREFLCSDCTSPSNAAHFEDWVRERTAHLSEDLVSRSRRAIQEDQWYHRTSRVDGTDTACSFCNGEEAAASEDDSDDDDDSFVAVGRHERVLIGTRTSVAACMRCFMVYWEDADRLLGALAAEYAKPPPFPKLPHSSYYDDS